MKRKSLCLISVFVFWPLLILSAGSVHAQTSGQIPVFDQPGTGNCNSVGGNDCIDSVITQVGGNIGIGTTAPATTLHVAGGNVTLENSTAGSGNILKDGVLFLHNFGTDNTFLGSNAGNLTTSGIRNSAIGTNALSANTTGFNNTASGASALGANTTGGQNTASGSGALQTNTTGFRNTASGAGALALNTTGDNNTAIGYLALENNCSPFLTSPCSLLGQGSNNTASGIQALGSNATGSFNTASGFQGLGTNTTGNNNTAVGVFADVSTGNLTNATAIGFGAVVNDNNKIRLGNGSVTLIEGQGDFHASGPGRGIILKSPSGAVCARLSIDDAGNLVTTAVVCP